MGVSTVPGSPSPGSAGRASTRFPGTSWAASYVESASSALGATTPDGPAVAAAGGYAPLATAATPDGPLGTIRALSSRLSLRWKILIGFLLSFTCLMLLTTKNVFLSPQWRSVRGAGQVDEEDAVPARPETHVRLIASNTRAGRAKACTAHRAIPYPLDERTGQPVRVSRLIDFVPPSRGGTVTICSPNARLETSSLPLKNVELVYDMLDPRLAMFDPTLEAFLDTKRFLSPTDAPKDFFPDGKDVETILDEHCATRRRGLPCTIGEIAFLRNLMILARDAELLRPHLAQTWASHAAFLEANKGASLRVSGSVHVVRSEPVSQERTPGSTAQLHGVAHKGLFAGLSELLERYEFPDPRSDAYPATPATPPIDAGSCTVVGNPKSQQPSAKTKAFARCLPSFMIIGAQKAGTDEMAVWLNFNDYHRRMDGGPETHFFDCVGRGVGQFRDPCYRGRTYDMLQTQSSSDMIFNLSTKSVEHQQGRWSWANLRRDKNTVDALWERYARLGQLDRDSYTRQPSRTLIFEKTPSYSDLADPRDVARLLPSVKLVFITRDPVSRLFSSYWQACLDERDKSKAGKAAAQASNEVFVPCSVDQYEEFVATYLTRPAEALERERVPQYLEELTRNHSARAGRFMRSAHHGAYARVLRPWFESFPLKHQILILDAHYFKYHPRSVVYAIESFVGNRGAARHREYNPFWRDGYWVMGRYSKASHPSTEKAKRLPSDETIDVIRKWYEPLNVEFLGLLDEYKEVIARGPIGGESFPSDMRSPNPEFYSKDNKEFVDPPWLRGLFDNLDVSRDDSGDED